jgi:hypothetical protein
MSDEMPASVVESAFDLFNAEPEAHAPVNQAPEQQIPDQNEGELTDFMPVPKQAPRPAPKPETTLPVKDESIPDHVAKRGEASIQTWKQLRAELDSERQRREDVERDRVAKETELAELQERLKNVPPDEKIKEYEETIKSYEDRLGQMDITSSKVFKEHYDDPINAVFSKVVRTFMKSGQSQDQALASARSVFKPGMDNPEALERALPDASSVVIGAVSTILEDLGDLTRRREEALTNWRQTREATSMEESRRASSEIGAQLTRVAQSGFESATKDGSWLYKEGEDEKWNAAVKARKDAAMGYLRAGKPEDLARLVAEGIVSPVYRKSYEQLKVAYDDLKAKYEGNVVRRPSLSGRAPASGDPTPAVEKITSVSDFVAKEW